MNMYMVLGEVIGDAQDNVVLANSPQEAALLWDEYFSNWDSRSDTVLVVCLDALPRSVPGVIDFDTPIFNEVKVNKGATDAPIQGASAHVL